MDQNITAAYQAERDGITYDYEHRCDHVSMRGSDGSYSGWDLEQYGKVKREREKLGIQKVTRDDVDHPLLGKTLLNTETGKHWLVEKVVRNWCFGSFLTAVVNDGNNSHAVLHIANLTCVIPATLRLVQEFQEKYRVVA